MTHLLASNLGRPLPVSPDETAGLENSDDLPLWPEEDMSVIPDEERVIDVPS